MGLAQRDPGYHTYGDYLTWPEDVRYELIDGVAYAMAPAPTLEHQVLVGALLVQIKAALQGGPCRALVAPLDVRLPQAGEADETVDSVVQPDLLVVCDPAKLDRRGVRGAPDWIIEVLSPATAVHDQVVKRALYERAGVREYWLVHPLDRVLMIYRLQHGAYGKPDVVAWVGETVCQAVPAVVIDWAPVVAELPEPER
jgi:Uma2 family endonuclease